MEITDLYTPEQIEYAVGQFRKNRIFREYLDKAPSEACRQVVMLEFCESAFYKEKAPRELSHELIDRLSEEDLKYTRPYTGGNPYGVVFRAAGRGLRNMDDSVPKEMKCVRKSKDEEYDDITALYDVGLFGPDLFDYYCRILKRGQFKVYNIEVSDCYSQTDAFQGVRMEFEDVYEMIKKRDRILSIESLESIQASGVFLNEEMYAGVGIDFETGCCYGARVSEKNFRALECLLEECFNETVLNSEKREKDGKLLHFSDFCSYIGRLCHRLPTKLIGTLRTFFRFRLVSKFRIFKNNLEISLRSRCLMPSEVPEVHSCSQICPEDCDSSEVSFVPVRLLDVVEAPADNAPGLARVELRQTEATPRICILIENERVLNRLKSDEYPMLNLGIVSTGAEFFPDRESFEAKYGQTDEVFDRIVYIEDDDPSPTLLAVSGTVLTVHRDMEYESGSECLSGIMECGGLVMNFFTQNVPQKVEPGWIIRCICLALVSDEENTIQGGKANEDN